MFYYLKRKKEERKKISYDLGSEYNLVKEKLSEEK
jgi:hypothetical protein